MLAQRRQAAEKIAAGLFTAEAEVSGAISAVAAMIGLIEHTRAEANLSAVVGSDAAFRVVSCLRALGEANQELVAAHHALAETKVQLGLRTFAGGAGGGDKPDDLAIEPALRAVA